MRVPPARIGPDDPRYRDLVRRGFNQRIAGKPDYVRVVSSTEQVIDAVQDAVREKLRLAANTANS
jgi:sugar-specific transcriptional regulator TrmB